MIVSGSMRVLFRAMKTEAETQLRRTDLRGEDSVRLLKNRSGWCGSATHPAIAAEVSAAAVHHGLPAAARLLHRLLARTRPPGPSGLEVMHPSPRPRRPFLRNRRPHTQRPRELKWLDLLMPDFETVH